MAPRIGVWPVRLLQTLYRNIVHCEVVGLTRCCYAKTATQQIVNAKVCETHIYRFTKTREASSHLRRIHRLRLCGVIKGLKSRTNERPPVGGGTGGRRFDWQGWEEDAPRVTRLSAGRRMPTDAISNYLPLVPRRATKLMSLRLMPRSFSSLADRRDNSSTARR